MTARDIPALGVLLPASDGAVSLRGRLRTLDGTFMVIPNVRGDSRHLLVRHSDITSIIDLDQGCDPLCQITVRNDAFLFVGVQVSPLLYSDQPAKKKDLQVPFAVALPSNVANTDAKEGYTAKADLPIAGP